MYEGKLTRRELYPIVCRVAEGTPRARDEAPVASRRPSYVADVGDPRSHGRLARNWSLHGRKQHLRAQGVWVQHRTALTAFRLVR